MRSRTTILLLAILAVFALPPDDLLATQEESDQEVAQQEGEAEAEEGAEFRNELALIIAGTYEDLGEEHPENFFTIGAKYQREVSSRFAVAGVFEYLSNKPAALLVFPVHFKVWEGLSIFAGPGVEFAEEEEDEGEDHDDGDESGDSDAWGATFLVRVGVGYAIEFGERYSFSPSIAFDFIGREQAFVYGADFSIKF